MTNSVRRRVLALVFFALAVPGFPSLSLAAGDHAHKHGHDSPIGQPGEAAQATRTIEVVMYDNYYEPEAISINRGETVRFVLSNEGEFVHEFNIGTAKMHVGHQPEMQMMVDHGVLEPDRINLEAAKAMQASMGHGMHEEPNSVLLEPGQSGEIVWRFQENAELEFACNVPGHYDSGMMGEFKLIEGPQLTN